MREACQNAVSNALGRPLTQGEARDIEARIATNMRLLARANPSEWVKKTEAERLTEAGKAAARELVAEARLRKDRLETRVLKLDAINDFVEDQVASGVTKTRLEALDRVLAPRQDGNPSIEGGAVDQRAQGIISDGVAQLIDILEAGKQKGFWRYIPFSQPGTNRQIRRALAGVTEGVEPRYREMAKKAHEYFELMRARYNAAGGSIGKLEDWGEPHRWSDVRLLDEIKKRGRDAVVDDFANAAVVGKYVHPNGVQMTKAEIHAFMDEALTSILTDGANKRVAGERPAYAQSIAANRHRAHREIHLRPEAVVDMLDRYSELGAMESLLVHMRALARDVAVIETFGPNADLSVRQLLDKARDEDLLAYQDDKAMKRQINGQYRRTTQFYDHIAGNYDSERNLFSMFMQTLRSLNTATSLGFTVVSSITDPGIMQMVARARGLDQAKLFVNDAALFTNNGRRWAKRAGLMTDTVASFADRFNSDYLTAPDMAAKAASFTLKVTGLNWVTEARRAAYGLTMMDAIGHIVKYNDNLGAIKAEDDRQFLQLLNVDDATWAVWRLAKLETLGANHTVLSPQSIYAIADADLVAGGHVRPGETPQLTKQRAATALLGIVKDEINTAVTTAGARERARMTGNAASGTFQGEIWRSMLLFRSFTWTFMSRQADMLRSMDNLGNRAAYAGSMIVILTVLGGLRNWIIDLLNGRDPRSLDPSSPEGWKSIFQAALAGGSIGFLGDFLNANADPGNRNQSLTAGLTGPVLSDIDEAQSLTLGNIQQEMMGQESNAAPEVVAFAQRNLAPNWWMTKAITDRYIFQALQEELQPGYNARRMAREKATRGTTYWWPAAEPAPDRAPDLSRITEGDMRERRN